MKFVKRILSCSLVSALMLSIMVLPVSASARADVDWSARIGEFKTLSIETRKTRPMFTKIVQKFMYDYSDVFKADLIQHGGVDGDFGAATERCVVGFQDVEEIYELAGPGCVGVETWTEIGSQLYDSASYSAGYIYFSTWKNKSSVIFRSTLSAPYIFGFYTYDSVNGEEAWPEFYRTYS